MGLKIHPEFWTIAKVQAQPKRGVSRDAPPIVDNLGDAVWRDADGIRKLVLRQTILSQKFFLQHFAWRNRCKLVPCHRFLLSMITHDPNFIRLSMKPFDGHSPLSINPDGVKVLQVTLELLQRS
jgi:hypothetical protein